MKKWIGALLAAGIIFQSTGLCIANVEAADGKTMEQTSEIPSINGTYGATIDANSGELIYSKDAKEKAYPASITKVLTAIVVKEHLKKDDLVTFSENAVKEEPSNQQILFKKGEQLSVDHALDALMIISSNDAAVALAEGVSGSVEDFAKLMNKKAKELGAVNSNFLTPNGLPNEEHYTTAYDMALIGKELLKHPDIIDKMGKREAEIKTSERTVTIKSPNDIPKNNPTALGGKTGYTNAAQHTLIEILSKDDKKVISVTMHSTKEGKYEDMNIMSEYAFSQITTKKISRKGEIFNIIEMNGKEFPLIFNQDVILSSYSGEGKDIEFQVVWNKEKSEYEAGEAIGWAVAVSNGSELGRFELITDDIFSPNKIPKNKKEMSTNIDATPIFPTNDKNSYFITISLIFIIPVITFFLINFIYERKRKKRLYS